jgi:hypothetical protein
MTTASQRESGGRPKEPTQHFPIRDASAHGCGKFSACDREAVDSEVGQGTPKAPEVFVDVSVGCPLIGVENHEIEAVPLDSLV